MANPENIEGQGFQTNPERINKEGRPRKIYTVLKESGYTRDDVRNAFNEIAWCDVNELQRLFKDENSPAIIKVIAHAYKRAIEKGDYRYVAEIINQSIGKPKETQDLNLSGDFNVTLNLNESNNIQPTVPNILPKENIK